ncbi:MAG: type 4a pilus biogenesis protein PilO [Candidatus Acidiferrales bacterium]|nr:type 4a pilus biogenesis protein PilO [Acidobacteriota bacterium]
MAFRFSELPWYYQVALFFVVAVLVVLAGEMLDLPPLLPVKGASNEKARLTKQQQALVAEVAKLQAVRQQHQEFRTRLQALRDQLERSKTFVPEEKQTANFMRVVQSSSTNARVSVRRLTARPVVYKEFYAEMPFEVEMDGGYYDLKEFFQRLGSTTRIVNVASVQLGGLEGRSGKYDYAPGTTVGGSCTVTTYFTPSPEELAAAAPPAGRR